MEKHTMTKTEVQELDRRNRLDQELVLLELKEIKEISKSNDRALRGSNGDAGLIADIKIIKTKIGMMEKDHVKCGAKFGELDKLLFGKDKDNAGMIGEQIALRQYVFKDLKPAIDRLGWWFFTLVLGLIVTGIVNAVIQSQ